MNARLSFLRATMAPAALATAIGLACAMSAPAQAQYTYPGAASSAGHSARISPMRAGARARADYANAPARSRAGNPSMQRGEACPQGSQCATPVPANGRGSERPSGGYGAHESYGYGAASPVRQSTAGAATASPVKAGSPRGALNYGPSQTSNENFRNSVTNKASGPSAPNMNSGQPTSVPGPNGPVKVGGSQTYTGANGKQHTLGQQAPNLTGTGYGHPTNEHGPMSDFGKASGGGAPQSTNGMDPYKADNGAAGAGFGLSDIKKALDWGSGGSSSSSTPDAGSKPHATPNGGPVDPNAGSDGIDRKSGVKVAPDVKGSGSGTTGSPSPEINYGPGEIVSGSGHVITPGTPAGSDVHGGQTDDGASHSGGQNAMGQYVAPSGQDNVRKPKEKGVLKMNYNGKNGATDPKLNGSNGGG